MAEAGFVPDFPNDEFAGRVARVQRAMADDQIDALLITTEPELRYFSGMTVNSVGEVLKVSSATVERDFREARAFLLGKTLEFMGQ